MEPKCRSVKLSLGSLPPIQAHQAAPSKHLRPAGELDLELLQRFQPACRVEGGFAVAPREQVVEATERFGVKGVPALRPAGDFLAEQQARRIPLSGIVIPRPGQENATRLLFRKE